MRNYLSHYYIVEGEHGEKKDVFFLIQNMTNNQNNILSNI